MYEADFTARMDELQPHNPARAGRVVEYNDEKGG